MARGLVIWGALSTLLLYFFSQRLLTFAEKFSGAEVMVHENITMLLAAGVLAKKINLTLDEAARKIRPGWRRKWFFDKPIFATLTADHRLVDKVRNN